MITVRAPDRTVQIKQFPEAAELIFETTLAIVRSCAATPFIKVYNSDKNNSITLLPHQDPREELLEFFNLAALPF